MSDTERLAALIREIDGKHIMGAGELAEWLVARGVTFGKPEIEVTMPSPSEYAPPITRVTGDWVPTTVLCDRCGRDWGSAHSVLLRAGKLVAVCLRCTDAIAAALREGA